MNFNFHKLFFVIIRGFFINIIEPVELQIKLEYKRFLEMAKLISWGEYSPWGSLFSTFAIFYGKLAFLTTRYVCVSGGKKC